MLLFIIFILGLVIGSFLAAYSYRKPLDIAISKGRSFCPHCKHQLAWYDNIPLLSFVLLKAKCRYCSKSISFRYFLIELSTGLSFLFSFIGLQYFAKSLVLSEYFGLNLIYILALVCVFIFIFVVDLEHQLIPDNAIFFGLAIVLLFLLISGSELVYQNILSGFVASVFLLIIYLITAGKGMGLGDVKFAILCGILLGLKLTLIWLFASFILGGIIGIILLVLGSAKLKDRIAFGPFLVLGMIVSITIGDRLATFIFPI